MPHITAADWGSVAFGQGYAMSEDRACTVIDQIVKVRGERARWFGPGENDEYVNSDFAYRHLGLWEDAPTRWADQSERVQQVVDGYVAGFNAQLDDNGITRAGAPTNRGSVAITTQDMYAYISDILLLASSRNLIQEIGHAQPPAPATDSDHGRDAHRSPNRSGSAGSPLAFAQPGASNGWALGADRSTTGGGLLLANPHFPWEGELRFWENHLTIPGELNVYGVGLTGLPGVQIGFNDAVAWTHTVSAGHRFTLYRYDLDPTDPTTYIVDGEPQAMTAERVHDRRARRRTAPPPPADPHAVLDAPRPGRRRRPARLDRRAGDRDPRRQHRDHERARAVPRHGRGDVDGRVPGRARGESGRALGQHDLDERRRHGPGSPTRRPRRTSPPRRSPRGRPNWPPAG